MQVSARARFVVNIALMSAVVLLGVPGIALVEQASTLRASAFEADTHWPSVPTGWVLGEVTSVAVAPAALSAAGETIHRRTAGARVRYVGEVDS